MLDVWHFLSKIYFTFSACPLSVFFLMAVFPKIENAEFGFVRPARGQVQPGHRGKLHDKRSIGVGIINMIIPVA